ncbi:ribosome small subunit-dependent GTPase A [Propioniciclava flava]|uniref:Small ribosomal subunit biogenesis GTPase RsgA n=1 Tax=Propioniciclava flava TaxID=2072026 RepID=A0A4Q2EKK0_9ACTN|nr:ribosome small subunit-dependent GTPase A [Propioniciclava flava]RXW33282.1 ribosome small subunit-dependent GTPase A [Propioniciclava flava]
MSRPGITYDEHDGYGRPPKRTRPRTKDRPDYSAAATGLVITVDRGRYTVHPDGAGAALVTATKARQLGRKGVIVGDRVRIVGDTSGAPGTLARIVEALPRETVLRRTADDNDPHERPIVANADQLAIVTALADPPPRMGMIDRILVAGYDAGLTPLLVLTKADLAPPDALLAAYAGLGVDAVVVEPDADLSRLRDLLAGHRTVFVGHSGVGKSTLVNALIPDADRATGHVNEVTGRGRHTSTSAIALELPPPGGWVIDTPGVRSFGLSHVTTDSILAAFDDLAELTEGCPRGCRHDSTAPECALDTAVARGELRPDRLESFRRMEKVWTSPASWE